MEMHDEKQKAPLQAQREENQGSHMDILDRSIQSDQTDIKKLRVEVEKAEKW